MSITKTHYNEKKNKHFKNNNKNIYTTKRINRANNTHQSKRSRKIIQQIQTKK